MWYDFVFQKIVFHNLIIRSVFNFLRCIFSPAVHCVNGQTYQSCGDSCKSSCQSIALSSKCKSDCIDGCNCPVGTTLSADKECIPISACPCIFDKKEYEPGYKQIRQNNLWYAFIHFWVHCNSDCHYLFFLM